MALIIAAHPDDEVLGCGGTIARLSKDEEVHILILGEGATSRFSERDVAVLGEVEQLRQSAQSAAKVLGASSVMLQDLPDNRFDQVPLLDIVKRIEHVLEELRPECVYTHHAGDLNIDHRMTFHAVLTATRPTGKCTVRELYSFEVPSSTEWAFQRIEQPFKPNVYVDVHATIDSKIKAFAEYDSEVRHFPHPRSPEALRVIARRWGCVVGLEYAEAFDLIRWTRF